MTAKAQERVMLFRAGGQLLGVQIGAVRRVLTGESITPIPRTPPSVAGAILFEGQAAPVFRLEGVSGGSEAPNIILILINQGNVMGLEIDNVVRVIGREEGALIGDLRIGVYDGVDFKLVTPQDLVPEELRGARGG